MGHQHLFLQKEFGRFFTFQKDKNKSFGNVCLAIAPKKTVIGDNCSSLFFALQFFRRAVCYKHGSAFDTILTILPLSACLSTAFGHILLNLRKLQEVPAFFPCHLSFMLKIFK